MNFTLSFLGDRLAKYLSRPTGRYQHFSLISPKKLAQTLEPCDLLLVEGNTRISTAIKYLTQSTWSHIAIYIGDNLSHNGKALQPLLEADLLNGVQTVALTRYEGFNVRICRPVNLSYEDKQNILNFAIGHIGFQYDKKNIFDLMRYLISTPPVPTKYRRQLIALGSGDPTKAICSTLIAQAFQSVHYPILPRPDTELSGASATKSEEVVLRQRHFSHFTPRDFDLSPYFEIVKPTIRHQFDYKKIKWVADGEGTSPD